MLPLRSTGRLESVLVLSSHLGATTSSRTIVTGEKFSIHHVTLSVVVVVVFAIWFTFGET